ncbi:unnamed protein product [Pylaiella littoralis]
MVISEDLYMLLNVDRTADAEEIRRAYHRLALCLHPDKAAARHAVAQHRQDQSDGPVLDLASRQASVRRVRKVADEQFVRVERAYRVLCDPNKRLVYDEYGNQGLAAFEQSEMSKQSLGMPLKRPVEVRRLMDHLLREAAQGRQDVALATFGGMTAECSCLPFLDMNGRLVKRNLLPELTRLTVRQSVQVPVADSLNVTFGGYSLHDGGLGAGSVYLSAQHDVSDAQWVGSLVQLGQQPKIGLSCGTSSGSGAGSSVQTQCTYAPDDGLELRISTTERLDPATVVDASWGVVGGRGGGTADDAATVHVTRLVGDGSGTLTGELAMGNQSWMDLGLRLSYRHMLSLSRTVQIGGKFGARGVEVEFDSRRSLPRQVKVKTALRLSDRGVSAIFSLQRGEYGSPEQSSRLYQKWLLQPGGMRRALPQELKTQPLPLAWPPRPVLQALKAEGEPLRRRRLARAWEDAASQARLMEHMAGKKRRQEIGNGGMVILLARYGANLSQDCGSQWWTQAPKPGVGMPLSGLVVSEAPQGSAAVELVSQPNVDVTVPLQFFVKDSTLALPPGSKSDLLGFFTPAPCRSPPRREWCSESFPESSEGGEQQQQQAHYYYYREQYSSTFEAGGAGPAVSAQLYVRYSFAGRTFEETFEDTKEVFLPSPTSTHQGGSEIR